MAHEIEIELKKPSYNHHFYGTYNIKIDHQNIPLYQWTKNRILQQQFSKRAQLRAALPGMLAT